MVKNDDDDDDWVLVNDNDVGVDVEGDDAPGTTDGVVTDDAAAADHYTDDGIGDERMMHEMMKLRSNCNRMIRQQNNDQLCEYIYCSLGSRARVIWL